MRTPRQRRVSKAVFRRVFQSPLHAPLQVAGVNYQAHVTISGKDYTVKVHRPLPHTGKAPEVHGVEEGNKVSA